MRRRGVAFLCALLASARSPLEAPPVSEEFAAGGGDSGGDARPFEVGEMGAASGVGLCFSLKPPAIT